MCYLEYLRKYFSNHNDRPRYCATSRRNMEGSEPEAILGNGLWKARIAVGSVTPMKDVFESLNFELQTFA